MPESPSTPSTAPVPAKRGRSGLVIGTLVGLALLAGAFYMWRQDKLYPSTDDASMQAHYVWISAQVPGQVITKYVHPNQFVKAGDPLFQIDPVPYQARLDQANAELVLVNQDIAADIEQISALAAQVTQEQDKLKITQENYTRIQPLVQQAFASQMQSIQLQDTVLEQTAKVASLRAQQAEAQARLGDKNVQDSRRQKAQASITLAKVNLDWTTVRAPADGYVTQFNLRVGDVVQPGTPLFPFIESGHWWILANFKETKVDRIQPGQAVKFTVDLYGGSKTFNGVVHSISRGVAASFSLLPPQNTTGNWVKVTQRVPVRILVKEDEEQGFPFRLGASVEATVDTTAPLEPIPAEPDNPLPPDPGYSPAK